MDHTTEERLKLAEEYFYSWKMVEAYNLLRRYFDRIPFKLEEHHAKYIGMFTRVLLELGKNNELDFYVTELEKHYARLRSPHVTYQLGMVYLAKHQSKLAKERFEELIRNPKAKEFHTKAKMCLMAHYEQKDPSDVAACRTLLDSIEVPQDRFMRTLVDIWKAIVLRLEKKYDASEEVLLKILPEITFERNWYEHVYVQLTLGNLYLEQEREEDVRKIIQDLRKKLESKRSKTVSARIQELEDKLNAQTELGEIEFFLDQNRSGYVIKYSDKTIFVQRKTPIDKLTILLVKKRFLEKEKIVSTVYNREYVPKTDDKLVYAQIHALRKKF